MLGPEQSTWDKVEKYVISRLLFNIYSESPFKNMSENAKEGILVNEVIINNNLRYVDNKLFMVDTTPNV